MKLLGKPVLELKLEEDNEKSHNAAAKVFGVRSVEKVGGDSIIIELDDAEDRTPDIVESLVRSGARVKQVNVRRPSLEDAYLELVEEENA